MQVIWVCILCRKKQELLSKTGQWINKTTSPEGIVRHVGSETRVRHFWTTLGVKSHLLINYLFFRHNFLIRMILQTNDQN